MRRALALFLLMFAVAPIAAAAQPAVAVSSAVFVELTSADAAGRKRITLVEPAVVTPGDKLVFVVNYRNIGEAPAANFTVTNPVPPAVAYEAARDQAAAVSVDGGRNWGPLSALRVRSGDGWRAAAPSDVTHIRWQFGRPLPPGGSGSLSFRGVVR